MKLVIVCSMMFIVAVLAGNNAMAMINLNERTASILSAQMDQTVSSCYYDLYLDPDRSNSTTPSSGDICNNAVMFFQEFCKISKLESCDSDYFKNYIKGMEG